MKFVKSIFLLYIFFSFALHFELEIKPQTGIIKNSGFSFSIPFKIRYKINSNFMVSHSNRLYNLNHPHMNYLHYNKSRENTTAINEESYIKYNDESISFLLGRKYIKVNNKFFFSDFSTSFDQIYFNYEINNFNYNYYLIKLNDETVSSIENPDMYISRWLYYREYSVNVNKNTILTFSESVLSSGENRNIDFYYLTPFGLFLAEQYHNLNRQDGGGDSNINNDNSLIGLNINHSINKNTKLDFSIIIDDVQIDQEDREKYQDVFGFSIGLDLNNANYIFKINYNYSSPWLYLNNGTFTNHISNNYPIGLRYPHYHNIEAYIEYSNDISKISSYFIIGEKGNQDFNSVWESENNKINYYEFNEKLPIEIFFKYKFINENKFIPNIILTHNWMGSQINTLILEWEYLKK